MMKLMSIRRRACLTTALVAGVVLASASLANARNNQHNDNNNKNTGARPHFVITGQSANAKRVLRDRKDKTKEVHCKKKPCEKPPTAGTPAKKPVGDAPATNPKTITISNGVTTYTLPFDPRFSVEVTKPGSITVHSGDRTVTLPGGSITVHGQAMSKSLSDRAGLEQIINLRGDAVFAVEPQAEKPAPAKPASNGPVQDISLGGQLKGVAKDIGNGLENLGLGFINLGGPTSEPKTGTITQE